MAAPRFTLPRRMRLRQKRHIRTLFDPRSSERASMAVGCIRIVYRYVPAGEVETGSPLQVGFSAGSRARSAVRRNHVKRHLREAFRLQQDIVRGSLSRSGIGLHMMIIFRGRPEHDAALIPADLEAALSALVRETP